MEFLISWSKTYVATGEFVLQADNEEHAYELAEEQLGNQEGSMQYVPERDTIEVEQNKHWEKPKGGSNG